MIIMLQVTLIYSKKKEISFQFCHFNGNKAMVSSAVDISCRTQKLYQCLETYVRFQYCNFTGNMAGIDNNQHHFRGKLFKATLYAT